MSDVRLMLQDHHWKRPADNRLFREAVFWLAQTGSPWRDLPVIFSKWNSAFVRFSRWSKDGVRDHLFAAMKSRISNTS